MTREASTPLKRSKRERLPLLRIAAATLLYWYVALNLPDWNAVIELYNAAH